MKRNMKARSSAASKRKRGRDTMDKLTDEELLALSGISMNKDEIKEIITLLRDQTGDIEAFFEEEMTLADIVKLLDRNISRKQIVQLITSEDPKSEMKKILE